MGSRKPHPDFVNNNKMQSCALKPSYVVCFFLHPLPPLRKKTKKQKTIRKPNNNCSFFFSFSPNQQNQQNPIKAFVLSPPAFCVSRESGASFMCNEFCLSWCFRLPAFSIARKDLENCVRARFLTFFFCETQLCFRTDRFRVGRRRLHVRHNRNKPSDFTREKCDRQAPHFFPFSLQNEKEG